MKTSIRPNLSGAADSAPARRVLLARTVLWLAVLLAGSARLAAQPPDLAIRQVSPEGGAQTDVAPESGLRTISPDGKWILFHADVETDNVPDIYAVRRFGGTPVRLSASRPSGSDSVNEVRITRDSRRAILMIDQETIHRQELWSVPIQGPSTAAIKLSPPTPLNGFAEGPPELPGEGDRVVFQFRAGTAPVELWSSPVDGSAPPVRLSPDLLAGGAGVSFLRFSADRAVFVGDYATIGRLELWSVPFDGSEAATRLSGSLQVGGDVVQVVLSPDGERVVYLADQRFEGVFELFSVPVAGPFSAAVRVSPDLAAGLDVADGSFSADGTRALFSIHSAVDGRTDLWSAPIGGPPSAAVQLNEPPVAGGSAVFNNFGESDGRFVYVADQNVDEHFELFVVPTEGPATAGIDISGTIVANGDVEFGAAVSTGGAGGESFVLATGDLRVDGKSEPYTAPLDGSELLGPLFPVLPAGTAVANCSSALVGQLLILCSELTTPGVVRLFRVPLDRSFPPDLVSSGLDLATSDVTQVQVDPTGTWAIFVWDRDVDERFDLFRARTDGTGNPVRVHPVPLPAGADVLDDDTGFVFTPDGFGFTYVADHDIDEKLELWLADGMVFRADFEWGGTEEWTSVVP